MERKVFRKKLLAILMIISLIAADFFVLSSNLVTYADEVSTDTNNENVEFSAYFKNSANQEDPNATESIKSESLKLFAKIKILTGYLNEGSTIEIQNSNFNLKNTTSSQYISSINGNRVTLKQIDKGETEIQLEIEPIISDKIDVNMLTQTSIIKLNGSYTGEKSSGIQYGKEVNISFIPDKTAKAELETKIVTNKTLPYGTTTKRVVQLLIESKLTDNQYPIETSTLKVNVPTLNEQEPEVSVLAIGELATNGQTIISSDNITNKDGELKITLNNIPSTDNEIIWKKNCSDKLLVTYIYDFNADMTNFALTANSEIKVFNSEETYKETSTPETYNEESNNSIMAIPEITTDELYKGQLYANVNATEKLDVQYETKTTLVITDPNISEETIISEGPDKFILNNDSKQGATTKYISTEIDKNKALEIIGDQGSLEITNGTTTVIINKTYIENNGNDNIVIAYGTEATDELQIKVIKPAKAGVLELKHIKVITGSYTVNLIKTIKEISTSASVNGTATETNPTEARLTIKETITKADLSISKENTLSSETARDINLGITLITNGEQYDLYNSPTIQIELPEVVESIVFNTAPILQNVNENDDIKIQDYNANENVITLTLTGSQKTYPGASMSELYIPLDLNVTTSKLASSQLGTIKMTTTNLLGDISKTDITEKQIKIEAPTGLIKWLDINGDTSRDENITQVITSDDAGKTLSFGITILNNTETDMNNVRILGKLPTMTTLANINEENVYYTENPEATADIENITNGWTTEFNENAKLYLIRLDTLNKGNYYETTANVQLPSEIVGDLVSNVQYEVIYDTSSETNVSEASRIVTLETYAGPNVEVGLTAQVGQDDLKNGDTVKEGEIIKYTVTATNHTKQPVENVVVKASVPNGTVAIQLVENFVHKYPFYEEKADKEISSEPIILSDTPYIMQYEVRVEKDTTFTEFSNKAVIEYNETTVESEELKNNIEEADISVVIKKNDEEITQLVPGGYAKYNIYVENLSDEAIKNLELQIVSDTYNAQKLETNDNLYGENITGNIVINELPANAASSYRIIGKIKEDIDTHSISVIVKDSNKETYRSNEVTQTLPKIDATIQLSSNKNNNTVISEGDILKYYITVTNTGNFGNQLKVVQNISEHLEIQSINVNKKTLLQTTNQANTDTYILNVLNERYDTIEVEPGKTGTMEIVTKVREIPFEDDGKSISNIAKVEVCGVEKDTSNEIVHILKASEEAEENLKNIISGLAWLDTNGNGQKDNSETALSDINVKIYDTLASNYLIDENGNTIQTKTNANGEYRFTKIINGEYVIVFEYDSEKYKTITNCETKIILNGKEVTVTGIQINVQDNISDINLALREKTSSTPGEDIGSGEDSEGNEGTVVSKNKISGFAWIDTDRDGEMDNTEKVLQGVKVKIYDVAINNYLKDANGKIVETSTDANGNYIFENIEKGSYIILFEYNTEEYEPTLYLANGVDTNKNSKVVLKKISINGEEKTLAVTDTINVQNDISNINIGLKEKLIFDLELNKYISRIVVQNNKGTKAYDYGNNTFAKVEIKRKQIQDSLVVLEYTIKVKNNGEMSGYVKNIVDYLPNGLTFSSELNTDWYLSGNQLYTKSLENIELKPGEEKDIKLILTKTMTTENTGLINNRAEIYQDYNKYGDIDIDSTPNNQVQNEDDFGVADVIIGISTGGSITAYIILFMMNIILICIAIKLMINNGIINISTNRGRR